MVKEGIDLRRMKHEEKHAVFEVTRVHNALVMHVKVYGLFTAGAALSMFRLCTCKGHLNLRGTN